MLQICRHENDKNNLAKVGGRYYWKHENDKKVSCRKSKLVKGVYVVERISLTTRECSRYFEENRISSISEKVTHKDSKLYIVVTTLYINTVSEILNI